MPNAKAKTPDEYLASLPEDRRRALSAVRDAIRENLDDDYEEGIQYGMIGYYVPHRVFPAGYHCDPKQPLPFAGLASQKNHMSLYLVGLYGSAQRTRAFQQAWKAAGKRLDMGQACVRFKKLEDVPLDVIGRTIRDLPASTYVSEYQANLAAARKPARATATKKPKAKAKAKTRAR